MEIEMGIEKIWSISSIQETQEAIGSELLPYLQNETYLEGVQYCLHKILPLENNPLSDLSIICYIISTLNLVSYSEECASEYKNMVTKLEKVAKALLDKNNIKAGKSKLSFLHGQIKQGVASILKNDGDTWGALWESSLGLILSRGSANPVQPFQHLSFAGQTIDRGFPKRVMGIIEDMNLSMTTAHDRRQIELLKVSHLNKTCQQKGSSILNII